MATANLPPETPAETSAQDGATSSLVKHTVDSEILIQQDQAQDSPKTWILHTKSKNDDMPNLDDESQPGLAGKKTHDITPVEQTNEGMNMKDTYAGTELDGGMKQETQEISEASQLVDDIDLPTSDPTPQYHMLERYAFNIQREAYDHCIFAPLTSGVTLQARFLKKSSGKDGEDAQQYLHPDSQPSAIELTPADTSNSIACLWIGMKPSQEEIKLVPHDARALRVVVKKGINQPIFYVLVNPDPDTGLCEGLHVPVSEVFFFRAFRDDNATLKNDRRNGATIKIRALQTRSFSNASDSPAQSTQSEQAESSSRQPASSVKRIRFEDEIEVAQNSPPTSSMSGKATRTRRTTKPSALLSSHIQPRLGATAPRRNRAKPKKYTSSSNKGKIRTTDHTEPAHFEQEHNQADDEITAGPSSELVRIPWGENRTKEEYTAITDTHHTVPEPSIPAALTNPPSEIAQRLYEQGNHTLIERAAEFFVSLEKGDLPRQSTPLEMGLNIPYKSINIEVSTRFFHEMELVFPNVIEASALDPILIDWMLIGLKRQKIFHLEYNMIQPYFVAFSLKARSRLDLGNNTMPLKVNKIELDDITGKARQHAKALVNPITLKRKRDEDDGNFLYMD